MTTAVTVVIPALGDMGLFERHLPPLMAELARRSAGDEVLVVDDTGEELLASRLPARFPGVSVLSRKENGGFARALADGVAAARHELVLALNSDVHVRSGFLEPLVSRLEDARVFAVAPLVLLDGKESRVESLVRVAFEDGEARLEQPALEGLGDSGPGLEPAPFAPLPFAPLPFAIGGACLFRKREFLELGGFDPLYEPFYLEDLDLGWRAWRSGARCLLEPASVVEHHHRGTIGALVPRDVIRAAIEKNRFLFQWKHLDGSRALEAHCARLSARALEAWICDEREELMWLALALEQLGDLAKSRRELPEAALTFTEIARASDPLRASPGAGQR